MVIGKGSGGAWCDLVLSFSSTIVMLVLHSTREPRIPLHWTNHYIFGGRRSWWYGMAGGKFHGLIVASAHTVLLICVHWTKLDVLSCVRY
jgi:hypothetical protein